MLGWALTSMDKVMLRTMCSYSELGSVFRRLQNRQRPGRCAVLLHPVLGAPAYRWYESKREQRFFSEANDIVACVMSVMCFGVLLCKDAGGADPGGEFCPGGLYFPLYHAHPIMYTMSETTAVGISFARKTGIISWFPPFPGA